MHGQFMVSSPLSLHLNLLDHATNIVSVEKPQDLPRFFIDEKLAIVHKNFQLNSSEKIYFDKINFVNEKSISLEKNTVGLPEKKEWIFL